MTSSVTGDSKEGSGSGGMPSAQTPLVPLVQQ